MNAVVSVSERVIAPSAVAQMLLVANGVRLELVRRRDLHVVALLMGLFLAGVLAARVVGIEKPSVGTFLLNLGLSLAYYCAHVLTLLLASRQLPAEIENRTLYPLLAKPISRTSVLLGKWIACCMAGISVFVVLGALAWLAVPKMEHYDAVLLAQTVLLIPVSIALVAALALLASLVWTRGVTFLLLLALFVAGPKLEGVFARLLSASSLGWVKWLVAYVPDFSRLDLTTRYTDGLGPLDAASCLGLVGYGAIFTIVALMATARLFERRPL